MGQVSGKLKGEVMSIFPGGAVVKNPPANAGDAGLIPGLGRSLEEKMQPISGFLPGLFHGQRSLVGYSPWGHRVRHNGAHAHMHIAGSLCGIAYTTNTTL